MIEEKLRGISDLKYRDFQAKLIPNIAPSKIIGVRIPDIRKLAKQLNSDEAREFMRALPHKYLEEDILHGCLISSIKDYEQCIEEIERFLPYIDNWAVCDTISPKCLAKHKAELTPRIENWIGSEKTYTVRFGIGMLMRHYLDADFKSEYADMAAAVRSEEYYINMMIAWYFATALAKQWDAAVKYIEDRRLEKWTHNKAIQKACESYRITPEQKEYLKTLKQL